MSNETKAPVFISLDEAAAMTTGTRVTFVPGVPAMFSEALKNICYVKGVPLIRVLHPRMGIDEETGEDRQAKLFELTAQTSLPTMLHDTERPRHVLATLPLSPACSRTRRLRRISLSSAFIDEPSE